MRSLTSSISSKVATMQIRPIPSRLKTSVLTVIKTENCQIKLEVANLKITSISSMQHSNVTAFILSNIKVSIFNTVVLSEMVRSINMTTPLEQNNRQFHFTRMDNQLALGPKKLTPPLATLKPLQIHQFRLIILS